MLTIKHVLLIIVISFCLPAMTMAQIHNFTGIPVLSSEAVPPVKSDAHGVLNVLYDDESNTLLYSYNWQLSKGSEATMAHFHGPAKRGEIASPRTPSLADNFLTVFGVNTATVEEEGNGIEGDLKIRSHHSSDEYPEPEPEPALEYEHYAETETDTHNDTPSGNAQLCDLLALFGLDSCDEKEAASATLNTGFVSGKLVISEQDEKDLLAGLWYLNFHTTAYPTGEIRAQLTRNKPQSSVSYFDTEAVELNLPLLLLGEQAYDLTLDMQVKEGVPLLGIKEFFLYGDAKPGD